MPIVNVSNHFIEENGKPVDPDNKQQYKDSKNKENNKNKEKK